MPVLLLHQALLCSALLLCSAPLCSALALYSEQLLCSALSQQVSRAAHPEVANLRSSVGRERLQSGPHGLLREPFPRENRWLGIATCRWAASLRLAESRPV